MIFATVHRIGLCHRLALFVVISTVTGAVRAQSTFDFAPPHVDTTDRVGVQWSSGLPTFSVSPVHIGPADNPLTFSQSFASGNVDVPTSGLFGSIRGSSDYFLYGQNAIIVRVLDITEPFYFGSDGLYHSWTRNGGTLTVTGANTFTYTDRNGAIYTFAATQYASPDITHCVWSFATAGSNPPDLPCAYLTQVNYPTGEILQLSVNTTSAMAGLVTGAERSDGYAVLIDYLSMPVGFGGIVTGYRPVGVRAVNLSVDYCNVAVTGCTYSRTWPNASYAWPAQPSDFVSTDSLVVTDQGNVVTQFTQRYFPDPNTLQQNPLTVQQRVMAVRAGTSASADTTTYQYTSPIVCVPLDNNGSFSCEHRRIGLVGSAITSAGTWSYSYQQLNPLAPPQADAYGRWQTNATRADGFQTTGVFNTKLGFIENVVATDGTLNYTSSPFGPSYGPNRITQAFDSEGREFRFTYDNRGNVLTKTQYASGGSAGPELQANYAGVCANLVTCNKPNWVRDPNGNQTDYVYDPVHGGVLKETSSADVHGIRPQKRYTYVQRYAWIKSSGGGFVRAATPIWKLNSVSFCQKGNPATSGTGCAVAGDEAVTKFDYGPDAGPNNLLLRGKVATADGQNHRTCYGYDVLGNKISETTPSANLASCS